jgi:hypothetical protein
VSRCNVVSSSGSSSLDNATCSILAKRARFTPARARTAIELRTATIKRSSGNCSNADRRPGSRKDGSGGGT